MTEAQRAFMLARDKATRFFIDPMKEFIEAATALAQAERARAEAAETALEQLRPVWAQGFTSDSEAAQASGAALAEIWGLLGVKDQTAAVANLRALLKMEIGQ